MSQGLESPHRHSVEQVATTARIRAHETTRPNSARVLAVIISYNSASYVERAIQSLLHQDCPQLRRLLIDDGSNDQTPEIASRYRDYFELVANRENIGFAANLNKALSLAQDEEFLFIHQDDIELIEPHYIRQAIGHLHDPGVAAVTGQMTPVLDSLPKRLFASYFHLDKFGDSGVYEVSWPHLKADLFRVAALRGVGGFAYAGNRKLGVEDHIVGARLHLKNHVILKDTALNYRVDFARCETIGCFVRKEADTGRCLGAAIGLGYITVNPNKSQFDILRRNHRICQILTTCFLFGGAIAMTFSRPLGVAILLPTFVARVLGLFWRTETFPTRERLLFSGMVLLLDVVFSVSVVWGLTSALIGRTRSNRLSRQPSGAPDRSAEP